MDKLPSSEISKERRKILWIYEGPSVKLKTCKFFSKQLQYSECYSMEVLKVLELQHLFAVLNGFEKTNFEREDFWINKS